MKLPPHVCTTCRDTGVIISPEPQGQSWAHPCPGCGAVRFTAGHVAKLYKRQRAIYGEADADSWLRVSHREFTAAVLAMVQKETAVQMRLL